MIVDSSAVMAVLEGGPQADEIITALVAADVCRMSTATWLELGIVADRRSPTHGRHLDELIRALEIELEPVTAAEAQTAREAHRRYGRGSGSPARLNYGDCFSYALSVTFREPLLFVGDDFGHTDVVAALPARGLGDRP